MKHRRLHHRKLGRPTAHRLAMLRTMACQLIEHGRIKTTHAKAQELKKWMDKCVTLGKEGTFHARVRAQARMWVARKDLIRKLFREIAPQYANRTGGYTRVMQSGWRQGDGARMAYVELVATPGEMRPARPGSADRQPLSVRQLLMAHPERAEEIAARISMPGVREMAAKIALEHASTSPRGTSAGPQPAAGRAAGGTAGGMAGGARGMCTGPVTGEQGWGERAGAVGRQGVRLLGGGRSGALSEVGRLALSLSSMSLVRR